MAELDVTVRRAGNSLDLRVPKKEARRLGLVEGRKLRVTIESPLEFRDLIGTLKGRISRAKLHAATNEDEDLD